MHAKHTDEVCHSEWVRLLHTIAQRRRSAAEESVGYSELQRVWLLFIAKSQEAWVAGFQERLGQSTNDEQARHSFRYPRIFLQEDMEEDESPTTRNRNLKMVDPLLAESAPYKLDKICKFQSGLHRPDDLRGPNHLIENGNSTIYRVEDGMHRISRAQEMGWSAVEVSVTSGSSNPIPPTELRFEFDGPLSTARAILPDGKSHRVAGSTVLFYQHWSTG